MKETFERLPQQDVIGPEPLPDFIAGDPIDFLRPTLPDELARGNVLPGVPHLVFIVMPQTPPLHDSRTITTRIDPLDELAREYGPSAFFDALRSGVHHELTDEEVGAPTWEGFVQFLQSSGQSMSGFIAGSTATLQHLPETVRTESLSLAETIQNSFDQIKTRQVPQLQAAIRQQFHIPRDIDSVSGKAIDITPGNSFVLLLRSQFATIPERSQELARQIFRIERDIDVGNGKPREPVIASTVVYDHGKPAREKVNDAINSFANATDDIAYKLAFYLREHPGEMLALDLSRRADTAVLDALIAAQNEASFILWSARHHPGRTLAFGSALVIQAVPVIGCVANANSGHQAEIAIPLPTPSSENTSRQPTPNIAQYSPNRGEVALNTESYEITSPEMVMAQAIGGLIQTSLKRADVASFTMVYFTDPGSSAQLNKGKLPPVYVRDKRDEQTYTVAFGGDSVSARLVRIGDGFDPKKNVYYDPEKGVNIPVFIRNSPDGPIRPEYFSPTLGGYIDASLWGDHDNPDDPKIGMAEALVSYTGYLQAATEKIYQEDPKTIVTIQPMNFKDGGAVRFQLLIEKSDGTRAVFVERTIDHTFVLVQKMQGTEMYLGSDGYWYYVGVEGKDFKKFDPNAGSYGEIVNLSTPEANGASPTPVVPPPTPISEPQVLPTSVNNITIPPYGGGGEGPTSEAVNSDKEAAFRINLEKYSQSNNMKLDGVGAPTPRGFEVIAIIRGTEQKIFVKNNGETQGDFIRLPDPSTNTDIQGATPMILEDGNLAFTVEVRDVNGNTADFIKALLKDDGSLEVTPWAQFTGAGVNIHKNPGLSPNDILRGSLNGELGIVTGAQTVDGLTFVKVVLASGGEGWIDIKDKDGNVLLDLSSTGKQQVEQFLAQQPTPKPIEVRPTETPPPITIQPSATPKPPPTSQELPTEQPLPRVTNFFHADFDAHGDGGFLYFGRTAAEGVPGNSATSHFEIISDPTGSGRGQVLEAVATGAPVFSTHRAYPDAEFGHHEGNYSTQFDLYFDVNPKIKIDLYKTWLSVAGLFDQAGNPRWHPSFMVNVVGSSGSYRLQSRAINSDYSTVEFTNKSNAPKLLLKTWATIRVDIDVYGKIVRTYQDGVLVSEGPYTAGTTGVESVHYGLYGTLTEGTVLNDNITVGSFPKTQ